jgi:hypothetical protein
MKARSYMAVFLTLVLVAFAAGASASNVHADDDVLLPVTHQLFNGVVGPLTQEGDGFVSLGNGFGA